MQESLERWLPVVGYEGLYEVSSHGRVRSLDRLDSAGRRVKGCILRPHSDKNGYQVVALCNGRRNDRKIHQLVAAAFLGPCPEGMIVLHGENGLDNSPSNLSYGTRSQNSQDMKRDGTALQGERHPLAKLTATDVLSIRGLVSAGAVQTHVAFAFGVSKQTVSAIVHRKLWPHLDAA